MHAAASAGTPPWVHPTSVYPDAVRAEIARRREQVLVRAQGRILDLDEPGVAARFLDAGRTRFVADAPAPAPEDRYDTVVAPGVLAAFADLGAVTAALARLVVDEGALLFVEPVGEPGWSHVVRTSFVDPR